MAKFGVKSNFLKWITYNYFFPTFSEISKKNIEDVFVSPQNSDFGAKKTIFRTFGQIEKGSAIFLILLSPISCQVSEEFKKRFPRYVYY